MRGESKFLSQVLKLPKRFVSYYFSCFISYSFLWELYVLTKTDFPVSRHIWGFLCTLLKFLCCQEYRLYSIFSQRKLFHLKTTKMSKLLKDSFNKGNRWIFLFNTITVIYISCISYNILPLRWLYLCMTDIFIFL